MRQKFLKSSRLLVRKDFLAMFHSQVRFVGECLIVDIRGNKKDCSRLGISASKRFGKSHERNRFKRIVREAYRMSAGVLPKGIDLHVRPRTKAMQAKTQDLENEILQACVRWQANVSV